MTPSPREARPQYRGSRKPEGEAAPITGGDSGIGRAVAALFAREGAEIVNSASVTACKGNPKLLDHPSTTGAVVAFTRALAVNLAALGIRVNAVAHGPIWTPPIPSTFPEDAVETFGTRVPTGRVGQPEEVAPCFGFPASGDGADVTGQTLHPNGGSVVDG